MRKVLSYRSGVRQGLQGAHFLGSLYEVQEFGSVILELVWAGSPVQAILFNESFKFVHLFVEYSLLELFRQGREDVIEQSCGSGGNLGVRCNSEGQSQVQDMKGFTSGQGAGQVSSCITWLLSAEEIARFVSYSMLVILHGSLKCRCSTSFTGQFGFKCLKGFIKPRCLYC